MYFPIGWPKILNSRIDDGQEKLRKILCNRDRILFAVLSDSQITIWFSKPALPITCHKRSQESLEKHGTNIDLQWRPDSTMLVITTSKNFLLFFHLAVDSAKSGLYSQTDSPQAALRRDSPELFIKEQIPPLVFSKAFQTGLDAPLTCVTSIRDELMVATASGHVLRYRWDGTINYDYCLDLRRTPFSVNQQVSIAIPIQEEGVHVVDMEYSPLVGGFATVLSDGRAAFLTASSLKFDPNSVQGIWAASVSDATCATVSHKYRLIVFGRSTGESVVCCVDESTGGLQVLHRLILSSKDFAGSPGPVGRLCWTPDSCALAVTWSSGGLSLWSVFGTLLACTLAWEGDVVAAVNMEWGAEGYQLWLLNAGRRDDDGFANRLMQLSFVKSALSVNPCMSNQEHVCLQGEDRVLISCDGPVSLGAAGQTRAGSKQWITVPVPHLYVGSNWPIRYTALDDGVQHVAVAGRTGVAHYSLASRRWKLFGNENQEKDFVVTGGLMWWRQLLLMGCYNIAQKRDEIRLYPRESRLDNAFVQVTPVDAQVLLLNLYQDTLIAYSADSHISLYHIQESSADPTVAEVRRIQDIDISALTAHPACVVSVSMSTLRMEPSRHRSPIAQSILVNICGRLLMLQRDPEEAGRPVEAAAKMFGSSVLTPTVLASMVESVWCPGTMSHRMKLADVLWINSGQHGMRVWLPLFPQHGKAHNFMSKRIMLPFQCSIYPLAVKYDDAVILGAENDTVEFPGSGCGRLPYCAVERTSQVYLQHILRQLLRRNLGYHAWEIAHRYTHLPYFSHALELLLHEVVEEEATSKEPIPDALLPRVIEFIREFPVYLDTVVRCARKTEMALWSYLFASAGQPVQLFQQCLRLQQLDTAASYLIILQNLETAETSRHYVTLLLDASLDSCRWRLAKDLTRFLRAIDPSDLESPRELRQQLSHVTPPVSPNEEDLSLVYGTLQVRGRSLSTSANPRVEHKEVTRTNSDQRAVRRKSAGQERTDAAELGQQRLFIDQVLERHARKLLTKWRLRDLGSFAAHMEFHLVEWLRRERWRAALVDDLVAALRRLHLDFQWPYPVPPQPLGFFLAAGERKDSADSAVQLDEAAARAARAHWRQRLPERGGARRAGAAAARRDTLAGHPGRPSAATRHARRRRQRQHHERGGILHLGGGGRDAAGDAHQRLRRPTAAAGRGSRGTQQAEVQLRYLLQIMLEAECVEWALLISIVLRDAMAVVRTVHLTGASDGLGRLQAGLRALHAWTTTECVGYQPFLQVVGRQLLAESPSLTERLAPLPSTRSRTVSGAGSGSTLTEEPEPEHRANL
ncbi:LOW QUALITY PROTEIN: guanine nucleotide exchange factor subunit Rich-like [Pollicipes pollicipes]|uniref:LOW QUALITY PROTEIN: guanine nucleotide exchange factor subunit Rich-like n=1 Tax=Pollicipes pollicipes TaxID=41117 RepID=UPI0018850E4F|nr:LOW QUALITY PROTEIN: guanine nucleotide exchange factor subunit Rich-like [Pollicipes pollicipes]